MHAARQLFADGFENSGVTVTENQGAMATGVIHVFIAIHIPLATALSMRDVDSVGLDVTHIVRDAAGNE